VEARAARATPHDPIRPRRRITGMTVRARIILGLVATLTAATAALAPGVQAARGTDFGDAADGARARYATKPGLIGHFPARERSNGARHTTPGQLRLGPGVTREGDSRQVDRDRRDDGFSARLRSCSMSTLTFLVDASRLPASLRSAGHVAYLNAWFDWNRDGDWRDRVRCGRRRVPEYRVQNRPLDLASFAQDPLQAIQVRVMAGRRVENIWQRASLTLDEPFSSPFGKGLFSHGETEDYLSLGGDEEESYCSTGAAAFFPVPHGEKVKIRFFTDLKSPSAKLLTDPLPQGVQVTDIDGRGATVKSTLKHRVQEGSLDEWQSVTLKFRLKSGSRTVVLTCDLVIVHDTRPPVTAPPVGSPPGGEGPGTGTTPAGGAQFTGFINAGPHGFPLFKFRTTADAGSVEQLEFGYTVNCTGGATFSDTARNFATAGGSLTIPIADDGNFSFIGGVTFQNPASQTRTGQLAVTGAFTTPNRAEGRVRLFFDDASFGRCDQGTMPWEANG